MRNAPPGVTRNPSPTMKSKSVEATPRTTGPAGAFPLAACSAVETKDGEIVGTWWCQSHGREATHFKRDGTRCCNPRLGGILLPCFAVLAPMTVERTKPNQQGQRIPAPLNPMTTPYHSSQAVPTEAEQVRGPGFAVPSGSALLRFEARRVRDRLTSARVDLLRGTKSEIEEIISQALTEARRDFPHCQ